MSTMSKKNISTRIGIRAIRRNIIARNSSFLQLCTSFKRKFMRPYIRYWWRDKYYH